VRDKKNFSEKRLTRRYSDPGDVVMRRTLCGIVNRASGELPENMCRGIEAALLSTPDSEEKPCMSGFNYGNDGFYIVRYVRPDGTEFYARAAGIELSCMVEFDETITEADLERCPPTLEDIR
jgi:hypothetical protein